MLETRELGRRPGAQRRSELSAEAPTGLGNEVVGVPAESVIELDVRLEAVMEGVLVSGTARARLSGECVRCLEQLDGETNVEFQELFVYPEADTDDAGDDEETYRLEAGDLLDLEPVVRDAIVLALPFQPVCREDCPGICATCGMSLADQPDHRHEDDIDPRWAALAHLARSTDRDHDAGAAGSTKE